MRSCPAVQTGPSWLDWGVAQVAFQGQSVSGDRHLVKPFADGLLLAVADGLGHGAEAAAAAETALRILEAYPHEPVIALLKRCHDALRRTRGTVISLASLSAACGTLTWLGVGNVEAVLLRADKQAVPAQESIMLFPGVAGQHLPSLRAVVTPVSLGDLLIFFTDGIRREFLLEPVPWQAPQRMADRICARFSKGTDDALVLVARYLGAPR